VSDEEREATATPESANEEKPTLKPTEDRMGRVFEAVSGTEVTGKFGMQVKLQVRGNKVIYVNAKSGIAKGLANGKLMPSMERPLRLTVVRKFGAKGPYLTWALAPRRL